MDAARFCRFYVRDKYRFAGFPGQLFAEWRAAPVSL